MKTGLRFVLEELVCGNPVKDGDPAYMAVDRLALTKLGYRAVEVHRFLEFDQEVVSVKHYVPWE